MRAESPQSCRYRPSAAAPPSTRHPVINAITLIVGLLFESLGHTGKSWVFSLNAFFPNNCVSLVVEHDVMSSDEGVALEKLKIVPKGLTEPVQLTSHRCTPVATHVQTVTLKLTKQACGSFTLWLTKQACGSCCCTFYSIPFERTLGNKVFLFPHTLQTWHTILFVVVVFLVRS